MRRFGRLRAATGLLHGATLVPSWLAGAPGSPGARARERRFFRRVLKGFGIVPRFRGADPAGPGTLYIANHVSWADIPLLSALLDADFVSKDDVAGWPLIGRLARRRGTLFVVRRRGQTGGQADAIAARLAAGDSLVLFAEGTTGDGTALLPFRTGLFAAAASAQAIQPLLIRWRAPDGSPLLPDAMRAFAWAGDAPLGPNVAYVAATGAVGEVTLLEPFAPEGDRKTLAARAHAAIGAAFET